MRGSSVVLAVSGMLLVLARAADAADTVVPDPALRAVVIDSAETESFLGVRVDTTGRIFVGGREALFVYEPDGVGGYAPRKTLLTFPPHAWVHDIEFRGDDLYVLTVSGLYHVPGGRVRHEGLSPRRLLWGVPRGHTHQCFHGMAWGPEGDLYVGMGDPLWYYGDFERPDHWGHWTFLTRKPGVAEPAGPDDWERTPYVGVGAILRIRPDGTALRVVAGGLRNDCGLTFDHDWNLFTNDNDHESMPADYVPGRLLHVTPRTWFGWPRGWSPAKTPDRFDLVGGLNDELGRFVPVGQSYYDDPFLPARYRHALLVARWCTRQLTFYPLTRDDRGFRAAEGELVAGQGVARPVGITVGRGGRLFLTLCHMDHNEDSPVYKSDLVMITTADDSTEHSFAGYDAVAADVSLLFAELAEPGWSRRKEAHNELLRRSDLPERELLDRLERAEPGSVGRSHLLWITGLRATAPAARGLVVAALTDADAAFRLQAVRIMAERFPNEVTALLPLLDDPDLLVRQAALAACSVAPTLLEDRALVERLIAGPATSDDGHLRQAAARLLAEQLNAELLAPWCGHEHPRIRLAATLATGFRLTIPPVHVPPADGLPLAAWPNPDASYRLVFTDGAVDLRDLGSIGTFTAAEHWKAAAHTPDQERLFSLLLDSLDDADERVRLQAAHFLCLLSDPRSEPVVAAVRARVEAARAAAEGPGTGPSLERPSAVPGSALGADRPAYDPATFEGIDWQVEAAKGDPSRGRLLFGEAGVGCSKCHAVTPDQSVAGGPSLADAGKRFAVGYLAESVLVPDKVVAPLFRATTVVTDDGRSVTGLVAGQTGDELELVVADGSRVVIPTAQIDERVPKDVSPMPAGLVRTPAELRDILAYLLDPDAD